MIGKPTRHAPYAHSLKKWPIESVCASINLINILKFGSLSIAFPKVCVDCYCNKFYLWRYRCIIGKTVTNTRKEESRVVPTEKVFEHVQSKCFETKVARITNDGV